MKKALCFLLGISLNTFCLNAQEVFPPFMTATRTCKFEANLDGKNKNVTVSPFYFTKYVESNEQYRFYLDNLKKTDEIKYTKAIPSVSFWQKLALNETEFAYLQANYWQNPIFDNYPVLGLSYEQISDYLHWKSLKRNEAALAFYKTQKPYYKSDNTLLSNDNAIFTSFRLPYYLEVVACFKNLEKPKIERNGAKLEKWLRKKKQYRFLAEPVFPSKKQKNVPIAIAKKLDENGIIEIFSTDFQEILNRNSYQLTELLMETSTPQKNADNSDYIFIKDPFATTQFNIEKNELASHQKKMLNDIPFFTFRTYQTQIWGVGGE